MRKFETENSIDIYGTIVLPCLMDCTMRQTMFLLDFVNSPCPWTSSRPPQADENVGYALKLII